MANLKSKSKIPHCPHCCKPLHNIEQKEYSIDYKVGHTISTILLFCPECENVLSYGTIVTLPEEKNAAQNSK